jgi:phosphoglycolate phosphatase
MRTVIFDLDGTLADTSGDLLAAANVCFAQMGHLDVLNVAQDAATAVKGGRAMLIKGYERLGLSYTDDDITAGYPVLIEAYSRAISEHTVLYDGAREAVDNLKSAGYRVGICTNKPIKLAEQLLGEIDFRAPFDSLIGGDSLPTRKPDPAAYIKSVTDAGGEVSTSLLVGDTATDRNTSKAAGVPSILVTFSPDGRAVADLAPEALLDHFDDLPAMVEKFIG